MKRKKLSKDIFAQDAVSVARFLIGKIIDFDGRSGLIIETESYTTDLASHARNITPRSALMRETYGHLYVYQTYGMYFCLNLTADKYFPGAVLIRAVEPVSGVRYMQHARGKIDIFDLCSGPGKVCQAFGISPQLSGKIVGREVSLFEGIKVHPKDIIATKRIGISEDTHLDWRFYLKGSLFVSR